MIDIPVRNRTKEQDHSIPLCESPPLCWNRSIYLHGDDVEFGVFVCESHHPDACIETKFCSRLLPTFTKDLGVPGCQECPVEEDGLYRPSLCLIQCTACLGCFCMPCFIEHFHMTTAEVVGL